MTRVNPMRRTVTALSVGVGLSALAVPAMAQDAAVVPPPVVATQPAPAPVTPPPVVRTIQDTVAPAAQADVQKEAPRKATAASPKTNAAKPSSKAAVKADPAPTVSPVEQTAAALPVSSVGEAVAPAAEADIATADAAPVAATSSRSVVPDQEANSFGASENDWLYWVGGLAGLLGLAGAGAALSNRRSRNHRDEHFADEGHVIVESHEAPSFAARPAHAAVPRADAQFAPPASSGYAAGYKSDSGVWTPGYFESMVDDGPSEVNPFLTRKNRLRRARFLDRQAANNEPIFDWRGKREIQFASQIRTAQEPELVH